MTNTQTNESLVLVESDDGIEALWRGNPLSDIFISYAEEFQQLVSAVADIIGSPKQPAAPRLSPKRSEPVLACKPESPAPRESPFEKVRKNLWIAAGLALGVVIARLVVVQMKGPESPQLEKAETAGKGQLSARCLAHLLNLLKMWKP